MPKAAATRRPKAAREQALAAPPAGMRAAIHWRLDAGALRQNGRWDHTGEDVALTLSIVVEDGIARAEATLSAGDRARGLRLPRELAAAACGVTEAEGLVHIDAPPLLTATLDPGDRGQGGRVLYARSGVLAFLGLAGGRYEVAGGTAGAGKL